MRQTNSNSKDAVLIKKAKAGDRNAMAALYEATYPEVWRTIHTLVREEDDALDILQDSYLKAFSRLDQLSDEDSLRPWLRQIAANTARDHLRKKKPVLFSELQTEDGEDFPEQPEERPEALPEAKLDRRETQQQVNELLDSLTDAQRLVIGLYYYEQLPIREISAQLGVSESTVKSRLRGGRRRLEASLRRMEQEGLELSDLAPMEFFRQLLQKDSAVPRGAGKLTKEISRGGLRVLEASTLPMKAVTAKGLLLRRVLAGVGAAAVLGGAAFGVGKLLDRQRDYEGGLPQEVLVSDATDSPQPFDEEWLSEPPVYENWQQAFLGALAGELSRPKKELIYYGGSHCSKAYVAWRSDAAQDLDTRYFYLCDLDGCGTPELIAKHGSELIMDRWTGSALEEFSSGDLPGGDAETDWALLYDREVGDYVYCAQGSAPCTWGHIDETRGALRLQIGDSVLMLPDSLPPEAARQEWNDVLSSGEPVIYRRLQYLHFGPKYAEHTDLVCFLHPETGELYGWLDGEPASREAYTEAEQTLFSRSSGMIEGLLDISVELASWEGPINVTELADRLGGFDAREEWQVAASEIEMIRAAGSLSLGLFEAYIQKNTPAEEWQYAVLSGDAILACHRTDGRLKLSVIQPGGFDPVSSGGYVTDTELHVGQTDGLCLSSRNGLCALGHFVQDGQRYAYLETQNLQLQLFPEDMLRPITLHSGEELLAQLSADPKERRNDLGEPVGFFDLLDIEAPKEDGLSILRACIEHPGLLRTAASQFDEPWWWGEDVLSAEDWDYLLTELNGRPMLTARCRVREGENERWIFTTVGSTGEKGEGISLFSASFLLTCVLPEQALVQSPIDASDGDLNYVQLNAAALPEVFVTEDGGLYFRWQSTEGETLWSTGWFLMDRELPEDLKPAEFLSKAALLEALAAYEEAPAETESP